MFERITSFFRPEDAQRKASLVLSRLLSLYDMGGMAYRSDLAENRRRGESRQLALGSWMIPFEGDRPEILDFASARTCVTYDMRRTGIGVLTTTPVEWKHFAVALPDQEHVWRFFECEKCHESRIPGGWYLSGLRLHHTIELEPRDVTSFRESIHEPLQAVAATPDWNS